MKTKIPAAPPFRSFADLASHNFPWVEVWTLTHDRQLPGYWLQPPIDRRVRALEGRFQVEQAIRAKETVRLPWSEFDAERLIGGFGGWLEAEVGRMTFSDLAGARDDGEDRKTARFYATLIQFGVLHQQTGIRADPLRWATLFGHLHAMGLAANDEIARRLDTHRPGHATALMLIAMYLTERQVDAPVVDAAVREALRYLRPNIGRKLIARDKRDDIGSEFVAAAAGHRDDDPMAVILEALRGRLDVFPKRVRQRLNRQAGKAIRVRLQEEQSARPERPIQDTDPRSGLDVDELLKSLARQHPDLAPLIRSAVEAADPTLTPRARARRLARLRAALGAPARKRGRPGKK